MQLKFPINVSESLKSQHLEAVWDLFLKDIEPLVGDSAFQRWFADVRLTKAEPEKLVISAPGSIYAIWIEENFKEIVYSTFTKYLSGFDRIVFEIHEPESDSVKSKSNKAGSKKKGGGKKSKGKGASRKKALIHEEISEDQLLRRGRASGLVEIYRFSNFVTGENSDMASAAAHAVADSPGRTYQPLFFHSASGLGKTHLLNAIGWETIRQRPKSKVLFVSAEKFANDYIDAIQKNSLVGFRKKYRELDLLLIDDVQFLGRKEGLQREFFHTFNSISDSQKQIVLASDCPASEIVQLEERLVSRFQWGLTAELHKPGLSTRAAILRHKRDDWNLAVSDEIINDVVERVQGNVRLLEGALIRVAMATTMNNGAITVEAVNEILADIQGDDASFHLGMEEIKETVSEHYNVTVIQINGKKRTSRIAEARLVSMYLIRTLTEYSLVEIGANFGKDHASVIYAVKRIKEKCEKSDTMKNTVELLRRRLARGGSKTDSNRKRSFDRDIGSRNVRQAKGGKEQKDSFDSEAGPFLR